MEIAKYALNERQHLTGTFTWLPFEKINEKKKLKKNLYVTRYLSWIIIIISVQAAEFSFECNA